MAFKQSNFLPTQFALFTFRNTSTNFTTNNVNGLAVGYGFIANLNTPANGDYIDWAVPGTITTGIYKIEHPLLNNTDIAIIDFSYKANGAGGYTNLRTGIDCLYSSGSPVCIVYRDYIQITVSGTLNLRWTVNGKSGSAYICYLGVGGTSSMPGIIITRIG